MKNTPPAYLEKYRVQSGPMGSDKSDGMNGAFLIPLRGVMLKVIASDGTGWDEGGLPRPVWEHVSVSLRERCPTWEEMDTVKRCFWGDDETVIQFHVPTKDHINCHPTCLHMWRPVGVSLPRPPIITVGPKS